MIVALAGHVDHGKTSLVRALTNVDTDRLAEEKARGLTIDLGFAYLQENDLGFVDVPGHHRFIHNMVAGVAEHQFALLVVAADDGPMPQTIEHLQILSLLGIRHGAVVLSKCDLVDDEHRASSLAAIQQLLKGSFLANAPIFPYANSDPESIAPIKEHLGKQAQQLRNALEADRAFRMPVDRAFNIKGSGTVVTGTVFSGSIARDQTLQIFPAGLQARVRSIRTSDRDADIARTGDRAALNLTGISLEDVARGSWLTTEPTSSDHLAISLEVLDDFPRRIRHWTPVHVYHGTSHTTARIALLDTEAIPPGGTALVDLICDEPLAACAGDRILVRDQSLDRTLGGGKVRDTQPPEQRRRSPARLARLNALSTDDPQDAYRALLAAAPVNWQQFRAMCGLEDGYAPPEDADHLERSGYHLGTAQWQSWKSQTEAFISERIAASPNLQGVRENELPANIPTAFRGELLRELQTEGRLAHTGGMFHLPRHEAELSDEQKKLLGKLKPLLDSKQPPSLGDLAKTSGEPLHKLSKAMPELAKLKVLDRINDNRYYLPEILDELADQALELAQGGSFDVRSYRDVTGIGRNIAIDVLEYFDSKGYTRRQGNTRIVAGSWRNR